MDTATYQQRSNRVVADVIAPSAAEVDKDARYPRGNLDALAQAGLLGLISAKEVGGIGGDMRAAAVVVEDIAAACGSTAMVVGMHYCGTAVIEKFGRADVRKAIAAGRHVTTLAFSEAGSRSHFWAPVGTAVAVDGGIVLDGMKSWITSAGEADSYVWSSKPVSAAGASTIWLVPAKAAGVSTVAPFDGLGMRGNASSPVKGARVKVSEADRLGADGGGFDVMMGVVLPIFQMLNASASLGIAESALQKAAAHVAQTRFQHLGQSLADLPTIRAYLAKARIKLDAARTLRDDTLAALQSNRADAMLRVLEVKAAAAEAALEITDTAMRVCGGAAFRKDVGIERHFRDARAASVMAPTSDVLYDFIGKAVCGLPLF
ncbi:MAG TPA: acyl-CoA dehydrogenase family protein [Burkholderiaceae bacterium]|nr:acyl-CoA dehydrogenase family protein [Burkholderiaceae bacterium]